MKVVLTGIEAGRVDAFSINNLGVNALVLMERAAMSVCDEIRNIVHDNDNILVVCGSGNNGGDGLAIARMLAKDYHVDVFLCENDFQKCSEGYKYQLKQLQLYDVQFVTEIENKYDCIVDAVFGIGLSREIKGRYADIINRLNNMDGVKIAVDCPSGVDCTTGKILGTSFISQKTITFGTMKLGLLLYPGTGVSGEIITKDIGFPERAYTEIHSNNIFYTDNEVLNFLPVREPYSNKGTYGKVVIIAGSKNMCGAAVMASRACYAMGAGLVKIITCEENREIIQTTVPEAILCTYQNMHFEHIREEIMWGDVVLIGPGLSTNITATELVTIAVSTDKPTVIDADALNVISKERKLLEMIKDKNVIITPHLGEMSRLMTISIDEISDDIIGVCQKFAAEYGVTCVLKDTRTIISNGIITAINTSGNCGMAKAGSGDVLAGIIAGLLAQKTGIYESGVLGVYLHGLSGDEAAKRLGRYSMSPLDTIECISIITKQVEDSRK